MARMNVLAEMAKGLKANIHTVDNLSPVSRVAVYVRAGSRYEPDHLPGIAHQLKASAGLTTSDSSVFGIARHMERAGATFKVTSSREHIIYQVSCLRDKLDYVLSFIDDTIHKPEFRSWELVDHVQPKLKYELSQYKKNQHAVSEEAMHKAAFRGGLAHSRFTPEHRVEKFTRNDLFEYFEKNFVLDRMTFTGLGCDHQELREIIDERFSLNGAEFKGVNGDSRYIGNGEARVQAGFPKTQVNFVVKGYPIADQKSLAALEVISNAIGTQSCTPFGNGPQKTLVALMKSYSPSIETDMINLNYSDTGLFGIKIVGPNEDMLKSIVKDAVRHVRQTLGNISENDLKKAKQTVKSRSLINSENQSAVFDAMASRHAAGLAGQGPLDVFEKLTLKDVQTVATQLLKSKPTMVAVGNPRFVPYIDELD